MNKIAIEVKSAIWQKVFISLIALFFVVAGIACGASAFLPVFQGPLSDLWEALITGFCLVAIGFGIWWPVMRYSIRANEIGIIQSNGFFHQSLRWEDVAYYYMEPNRRFHGLCNLYVEPVMFNAKDEIIFHGYFHIVVSTKRIIGQRNKLWQFVEEQLQGKKIDAPSPDRDPEALAFKSMEVNWSEKSWLWITGRMIALILYAVFWICIWMILAVYLLNSNRLLSSNQTANQFYSLLLLIPLMGPFLLQIIWLEIKKRKIAKEVESQDENK